MSKRWKLSKIRCSVTEGTPYQPARLHTLFSPSMHLSTHLYTHHMQTIHYYNNTVVPLMKELNESKGSALTLQIPRTSSREDLSAPQRFKSFSGGWKCAATPMRDVMGSPGSGWQSPHERNMPSAEDTEHRREKFPGGLL